MENLTESFGILYHPFCALVFYQNEEEQKDMYVEHFDMDKQGNPINAHPLTVREGKALAKKLNVENIKSKAFLQSNKLLPTNILHINPSDKGSVIWYTKAQRKNLFFNSLEIENGEAEIPALLWFANRQSLSIFALTSDIRPNEKTKLYHAPFFNVYEKGSVCMGTVDVSIKSSASTEEFIEAWENSFFNSYFTHLNSHNPIDGNCVNLWKGLVNTAGKFPKDVLKSTGKTLKNLIL